MKIEALYDELTYTLTYVVYDEATKDALIIDPVLDFDPASGKTSQKSVEKLMSFVNQNKLNVHYILETHAHADHISGAHDLKLRYLKDAKVGIGEHIKEVQATFKNVFNLEPDFKIDGSQFDALFKDGDQVTAGSLVFKVMHTPGHTPACVSYIIGDAVFTGDTLFMPDYGTGRCDFPKGDADAMYTSISEKLYSLPDETRVFTGHDYQPGGRALRFESTIGEEKEHNIQLRASTTREQYVSFRHERDAQLAAPRLLFPSVQVNVAAGEFPSPESNGKVYLKTPITLS